MGKEESAATPERYHAVVLLGKKLICDQITVEFASRIYGLVKHLRTGLLKPDLICFVGGKRPGGSVSEAFAGYMFFRQLCENREMSLKSLEIYLDEYSKNSMENVHTVLAEVKRRTAEAVDRWRLTLISSDYHINRLREVHRINPAQSLLGELEKEGVQWDYIETPYPFRHSANPVTAWLGAINLLRDELTLLRVNLEGVLANRESLSVENVERLAHVEEQLQLAYNSSPSADDSDVAHGRDSLESAILLLDQCYRALNPLVNVQNPSITQTQEAEHLLCRAIRIIKENVNPDTPLKCASAEILGLNVGTTGIGG